MSFTRDLGLALGLAEQRKQRADKHRNLVYNHGITLEEFEALSAAQGHRCVICRAKEPLKVDHDHGCCVGSRSCGKCIRGLLCGRCNAGLGMLGDSADSVLAAALYLLVAESAESCQAETSESL